MTRTHVILAFLLSFHAAAHAQMGFDPSGILMTAVALGASAALGAYFHPRLANLFDIRQRGRVLAVVWMVYGALLLFLLVGITNGERATVARAVSPAIVLQAGFLVFAGAGRGYIGVHQNALTLTCVAGLHGGLIAAVAFTGYAALVVLWLVLDHYIRKQGTIASAWRAAIPLCLVTAGFLSTVFAAIPPRSYAPISPVPIDVGSHPQLVEAYMELIGWTVAGAILLTIAVRLMGYGRSFKDEINIERIDAHHGKIRRRSEAAAPETEEMPGWRGKVVRLYLKFLEQVRKLGVRRRPDWTPSEFARKLPPSGAVLAEIFVRARYGPEDVSEGDFQNADRAASEAIDELRGRGR